MHLLDSNFVGGWSLEARWRLGLIVLLYVVICSISAILVARTYPAYHYFYHAELVVPALWWAAAFAPVFLLFVFAGFSFGYFIGFYFASMILGYFWLSQFSDFDYDRKTAQLSAFACALAFLLPALFINAPIRRRITTSERGFDIMLTLIVCMSFITLIIAATYNFQFVAPADASNARTDSFPAPLRYLLGITSVAALPFVFACDVNRRKFLRAGFIFVMMLFYYPVTMTKTALFAPPWLLIMIALLRTFGPRPAVILSLLLPGLAGLIVVFAYHPGSTGTSSYFFNVNFRMLAIPSVAIDVYNAFFSNHQVTHFCQIGMLKRFVDCPYSEPLSIVMRQHFPFGGNFNASLFATEGIASVGNKLAPIPVLAGGLVMALANRLSVGLPPSIVLPSSAIFCQVLLNVPLSTALLSYGGGVLFLLWYVTPLTIFAKENSNAVRGVGPAR